MPDNVLTLPERQPAHLFDILAAHLQNTHRHNSAFHAADLRLYQDSSLMIESQILRISVYRLGVGFQVCIGPPHPRKLWWNGQCLKVADLPAFLTDYSRGLPAGLRAEALDVAILCDTPGLKLFNQSLAALAQRWGPEGTIAQALTMSEPNKVLSFPNRRNPE